MDRLTRRSFGKATAAAAVFAVSRAWASARAAAPEDKTLRFIAQADLRILDPIWTTAYITRNHGYMVFDTLFALDSEFTPHPQMVGDYNVSPDKLTYRFKLRDGLAFHDRSPVRVSTVSPRSGAGLRAMRSGSGWCRSSIRSRPTALPVSRSN